MSKGERIVRHLPTMGLLVGLVLLGYSCFKPDPALCAYCPTYTCYSSMSCGYGCTCITPPGKMGGQCWGTGAK